MNRYEQDHNRYSREEDYSRRPEGQYNQAGQSQQWRDDGSFSRSQRRGGGGDPTPDYGDDDPRFLPQYGSQSNQGSYGYSSARRGPGARSSNSNFGGSFGTSEARREYDRNQGQYDRGQYDRNQGPYDRGQYDRNQGQYDSNQGQYDRNQGRSYDARWDDDDAGFFGSSQRSSRESYSRGRDTEYGRGFGGGGRDYGMGRDQSGSRSNSSSYGYDSTQGQFNSGSSAINGPHSGRGPKGYKRSDEQIIDDVSRRLEQDGEVDASEIEVTCKEGIITLKGKVEDRRAKRKSEECAEGVHGVKDVMNELKVDREFASSRSGSGEDRSSASSSSKSGSQSGMQSGTQTASKGMK